MMPKNKMIVKADQMRLAKPAIKDNAPINSMMITRKPIIQGKFIVSVKKPIVPVNPYPPNIPSIFCAPCGNKIKPIVSRLITPVQSLFVLNILFFIFLIILIVL